MRTIIAAVVFATLSSSALALSTRENGYAWNKVSAQEKTALVKDVHRSLGTTYPWAEIRDCLDTFYARPAADYILRQEIALVMALCDARIEQMRSK